MGYPSYDLTFQSFLEQQAAWSAKTFGPGKRTRGICAHITKELAEVAESDHSIDEAVDVLILALDLCWRSGAKPHEVEQALEDKFHKNQKRKWPDWRTMGDDEAIEHDRTVDTDGD